MFRTHSRRILFLLFLASLAFLFTGCDGYREREVRIAVNNRTQDRLVISVNGQSVTEIGPGAQQLRVRVPVENDPWRNNVNGPQLPDRAVVNISALNLRTRTSSRTFQLFITVGDVGSVDFDTFDFPSR